VDCVVSSICIVRECYFSMIDLAWNWIALEKENFIIFQPYILVSAPSLMILDI